MFEHLISQRDLNFVKPVILFLNKLEGLSQKKFDDSLIFTSWDWSLLLKWGTVRCSTRVGSGSFKTRLKESTETKTKGSFTLVKFVSKTASESNT
jgi:hypothetical protein